MLPDGEPGDVEVLTRPEAIRYELNRWIRETSIGMIFQLGVAVSLLVGTVIVYQVLSSDVAAHMRQYATLKAMGYTNRSCPAWCWRRPSGWPCWASCPGWSSRCGPVCADLAVGEHSHRDERLARVVRRAGDDGGDVLRIRAGRRAQGVAGRSRGAVLSDCNGHDLAMPRLHPHPWPART